MTRRTIALMIALSAAGCGQKSSTAPAASPTPSAEPAAATDEPKAEASSEPAAEEKKPLSVCDQAIADFDKTLQEASYECKKDADCGCFEAGLSRKPGNECGGVTDKAAAKKLADITKASKKDACSNGAMCEPWTCVPICEESRCQKGPRKK
jgi:hypothetical protein